MLSMRLATIAFLAAAWCSPSHAHLRYDVACFGTNNELKCPDGHYIKVTSVDFGLKSPEPCTARDKPTKVSNSTCMHWMMPLWVKSVCDGWQYCRLPKPDQRMFTCKMDNPFIQVSYKCHKHSPDLKTLVACDGETANVKCDEGQISIKKTNYGRLDLKTCMKGPAIVTWCMSEDADETVNTLCNGKKECEIPVDTNLTTKGGCDDSPKYLILQYVCQ